MKCIYLFYAAAPAIQHSHFPWLALRAGKRSNNLVILYYAHQNIFHIKQ